jgi:hypothetical protein
VSRLCLPTINPVDANDIFQDRGALVGRLPVQQNAVGFDSSKRDEGCDGDFEAKHLHELFNRLREDLICAKGDPMHQQSARAPGRSTCTLIIPEERKHDAGSPQPSRGRIQHRLHVVAGNIGRPVERRRGRGFKRHVDTTGRRRNLAGVFNAGIRWDEVWFA